MSFADRTVDSWSETEIIRVNDQLTHAKSVAAICKALATRDLRSLTRLEASSILS